VRPLPLMIVLGLVTSSRPASATPNFPATVQKDLGLAQEPACTLCHRGGEATGTVVTPFGTALRNRGLVAYDESSLANALQALEGEKTDANSNGVPDIDELRAGADPNAGAAATAGPVYGCNTAPQGPRRTVAGTCVALFLLALRRRRKAAPSFLRPTERI
jgi:hypothetical protein